MSDSTALRIGVILGDADTPSAFETWCTEYLVGLSSVALVVAIQAGAATATSRRWDPGGALLWRAVCRYLLTAREGTAANPASAQALRDLPRVCLTSSEVGDDGRIAPTAADAERVREYRPDIILSLVPQTIAGDLLAVPRYGLWAYRMSGTGRFVTGLPGFFEILDGEKTTDVLLQRLAATPEDSAVLYRGSFRTMAQSPHAQARRILQACAQWPARACRGLLCGDVSYAEGPAVAMPAPDVASPTNRQVVAFLANVLRTILCCVFQKHDKWNVGVIAEPIHRLLSSPPREVRWLPERRDDMFLADPFARRENGRTEILAEEYDYRSGKGRLVAIERPDDGPVGRPEVVLEMPFHLAYPFILEHAGRTYCIPEPSVDGNVVLYRFEGPGLRNLREEAVLMEGFPAVDPTVFQHEGRWWMLCTHREYDNTELHAFWALDLLGPWQPHVGNPVKTDTQNTRPAGTPFVHEGHLYRPAQNCVEGYGRSVTLNEVVRLTPTSFEEQVARVVEPDPDGPYPAGLHTISAAGDWTVIDGKRRVFSPGVLARRIIRRRS